MSNVVLGLGIFCLILLAVAIAGVVAVIYFMVQYDKNQNAKDTGTPDPTTSKTSVYNQNVIVNGTSATLPICIYDSGKVVNVTNINNASAAYFGISTFTKTSIDAILTTIGGRMAVPKEVTSWLTAVNSTYLTVSLITGYTNSFHPGTAFPNSLITNSTILYYSNQHSDWDNLQFSDISSYTAYGKASDLQSPTWLLVVVPTSSKFFKDILDNGFFSYPTTLAESSGSSTTAVLTPYNTNSVTPLSLVPPAS